MYYTNYILLRLKLFMLSPIFPSLLTMLACITFLSINSVMLCDDQTLESIKNTLLYDTIKYHSTMIDYKSYDEARWEAVNEFVRNSGKIDSLNRKASDSIGDATKILAEIRKTEFAIQKIEPSFESGIQKQWFEINLFNKKPFVWKS